MSGESSVSLVVRIPDLVFSRHDHLFYHDHEHCSRQLHLFHHLAAEFASCSRSLANQSGMDHVLVGQYAAMRELVGAALETMRVVGSSNKVPEVSSVPSFDDLFVPHSPIDAEHCDLLADLAGPQETSCYFHFSGEYISASISDHTLTVNVQALLRFPNPSHGRATSSRRRV